MHYSLFLVGMYLLIWGISVLLPEDKETNNGKTWKGVIWSFREADFLQVWGLLQATTKGCTHLFNFFNFNCSFTITPRDVTLYGICRRSHKFLPCSRTSNLLKHLILRALRFWPGNSTRFSWTWKRRRMIFWLQGQNLVQISQSLWLKSAILRYVFISSIYIMWCKELLSCHCLRPVLSHLSLLSYSYFVCPYLQKQLKAFMSSCFTQIISSQQSLSLIQRSV